MTASDAILTIRSPAGETVSVAGGSFLPLAFACPHPCTQLTISQCNCNEKVENIR